MKSVIFTDSELKEIALNEIVESQNWLEFNKKTSVSKVQQQQAATEMLMRNVVKLYKNKIAKLEKENPEMDDKETMPIAYALGQKRAFEGFIERLECYEFLQEDHN